MTDWRKVYSENSEEYWIGGTVSREELNAESALVEPRSLFDKRLKRVVRELIDEQSDEEFVHIEALVRTWDPEE